MYRRIILAIPFITLLLFPNRMPGAEGKQLFNGKDMKGWEHVGPGGFTIENGMLKSDGGMGLLWYTPEKFGNVKNPGRL